MAVAFPDDLAHSFQADCELKKLDSQQILVILTRTTREVLNSIAENKHISYKNEEIELDIKIPIDDVFIGDQEKLDEEKKTAFESDDKHDIEQATFEQEMETFQEPKPEEIETQKFQQEEEVDGKQMITESEELSHQDICIEIPIENYVGHFLQDKKKLLRKIIYGKFNCIATLCKNENKVSVHMAESSAEDVPTVEETYSPISSFPTGVRYLKTLPGGLRIYVCLDDLTKHEVDVVVNSANEYLKHEHGLARALARSAGQTFEIECDNIVQQHGAVPVGSAVRTGAGKLPCKKVIHAVTPIWSKYPSSENDRLLSYAVRNSLVLANELQMTSIAIPALGSGNGFPLHRCVELIVSTVKAFHGIWNPKNSLKEIHLVNFSEPTTTAVENACKNILGETEQKRLLCMDFVPNRIRDVFEFQNLHIEIKKERIEEQNTDVIVSAISRDLNLNLGKISKAISELAGPELQKELHRIKKTELLAFGDILKTSGYRLSCEYVYHVAYAPGSYFDSEKLLKKVITNCIELTKEDKTRSISIPVTSDVTQTLSSKKMAKILLEEILNHVEGSDDFKINTIYIVLHPAETDVYEAFLQELNRLKHLSRQSHRLASIIDSIPFKLEEEEGTEMLIKVCGRDYPFLECAQFWITNFLLTPEEHLTIENKSINYFTVAENETLLDLKEKNQINMKETVNEMGSFIELNGPHFHILEVALHVEKIFCDLQEEIAHVIESELVQFHVQWIYISKDQKNKYEPNENFILEMAFLDKKIFESIEVSGTEQTVYFQQFMALNDQREQFKIERVIQGKDDYLKKLPSNWGPPNGSVFQKVPMHITSLEFQKLTSDLADVGLTVLKIDRIENPVLWNCHLLKKEQDAAASRIESQVSVLYKWIPAEFCRFVCRIGFHEIYSPENKRKYGDGIYFSSDVKQLMKEVTKVGKIIHIFEAEVFIGNCCKTCPSYISSAHRDFDCYEFSENSKDNASPSKTYVIFNSVQAYPKYLIACRRWMSL
ncbi:protein mono-ADP-ribosyltransferase PARP9 [Rhincodon typus]|uniref:protein mono-ADP-ribosyltransferase PARP9 n=1 Tax=Rhincodon typus TaxID=259920 RepID=UPI0020309875|nr:protein mono-ADP-ribosyltransferase PARP9 [Rhincodon typus]